MQFKHANPLSLGARPMAKDYFDRLRPSASRPWDTTDLCAALDFTLARYTRWRERLVFVRICAVEPFVTVPNGPLLRMLELLIDGCLEMQVDEGEIEMNFRISSSSYVHGAVLEIQGAKLKLNPELISRLSRQHALTPFGLVGSQLCLARDIAAGYGGRLRLRGPEVTGEEGTTLRLFLPTTIQSTHFRVAHSETSQLSEVSA